MTKDTMAAARNLFIRRWGEMAARWGISRTMAEIHALLYLSAVPLCTDDLMEQLAVSRGSASMNLRELVNWGLIQRVHHRGDRKEYFEAEKNVWTMFETISRERRRREVQPIVETIEQCLLMIESPAATGAKESADEAATFRRRVTDILEFCNLMNMIFNIMTKAGQSGVAPILKRLHKLAG